jgi:malate dehydrogenase (oxaloacetate-decarboxylating)
MKKPNLADLTAIEKFLAGVPAKKREQAKTFFYKSLALKTHKFYGGKTAVMPKAALPSPQWLNVYYTPGVSAVSTAIRDNNALSFDFSNRSNSVAIVSDSTRVLGDGDCGASGGLGVMEGKALLMKLLGGIDACALCIDSRDASGQKSAAKIIDFVKMCAPSFGAINLEDISQPNCHYALGELRETLDIAVWHDDAQGTACVIAAGFINALKVAGKEAKNVKIVLYGAGAANSTVAKFIIKIGVKPENIIMFDSLGALGADRDDIKNNKDFYKQWELCQITNPRKIKTQEEAFKNADAVIALSKPGPGVIKPQWLKLMAAKAIVFACANPVPEIYPDEAKAAGAFVTATGRGDFENQLNNSLCFPGVLKGALLCRAAKITDDMAIAASYAIAKRAEQIAPLGVTNIVPNAEDEEVCALQAAAVAKAAKKEGLARVDISAEEVYEKAKADVARAKTQLKELSKSGLIAKPPKELIDAALKETLEAFSYADNKSRND